MTSRFLGVTAALLIGLLFASCANQRSERPDAEVMSREVGAFTRALPALERLGVVSWENSPSCRSIDYVRGNFQADTDDGLSCYASEKAPQPFDRQAEADHAAIGHALAAVGLEVDHFGWFRYDQGGRAVTGRVPAGTCSFYELDLSGDDHLGLTEIEPGWYFLDDDGFC